MKVNPSTFSLGAVAPEAETNYSFICLQIKKGELRNDQFFQHKANLVIHERSSKGRVCPWHDAANSQLVYCTNPLTPNCVGVILTAI
jgi:hypothetical protein